MRTEKTQSEIERRERERHTKQQNTTQRHHEERRRLDTTKSRYRDRD
jgi:hypothetical protein